MYLRPIARALVYMVAIAAFNFSLQAQSTDGKRPITSDDYGQWERLGMARFSADGNWMAYPISRVNEETELRVRRLDGDELIVVPYGANAAFSEDSRWLAYSIGVSEEEREKLEEQKEPVRNKLGLRNLVTGDSVVIADVAAFTFSDDGAYLAMRRYAPEGANDRKAKGVDVVVRTLSSGLDINFGNVSEFAWQEEGTLLAMLVDAAGEAGNGVQVFDPTTGVLRTLDSRTARYTGLTWKPEDDELAVLQVRGDDRYEDSTHVILAWAGLAGRDGRKHIFDPDSAAGFPSDMRIVSFRRLRWSDDGETVFFGIKDRELRPDTAADSTESAYDSTAAKPQAEADDEKPSTVQIWHAADVDLYPQQKVNANRDREKNFLAAWHVREDRFVQLGTELTEDVTLVEGDQLAVGTDQTPYENERMFGPVYRDLYVIDASTGAASEMKKRVQYNFGPSSGGNYLLYLMDDHYWTYHFRTGRHTNITEDVPTSFVDIEDDHTVEQKPPFRFAGWTEDDRYILIYDKYDVWQVDPRGAGATRLTNGAEDQIRYRRTRLDPDEEFIDMAQPLYFSTYGEWSKQYGYARLRRGRETEQLVALDANVSRLVKAKDAEVYAYMVQDFDDSPDYFCAGPDLSDSRQVTQTNPFQSDFAWGRSALIEYETEWGKRLQGALFYPADYQPARQYPMIVYIYEIRSPTVHTYYVPSDRSAYNTAVFTSQGYFVLQPDIVYRDRNPGLSAVAAIEPAVQKVLETGMVDPDRVGLTGHSWGGYQTAFTVTQTNMFAAAAAGAPLTNLVSMYLSVYWNTGSTDARIFEISQGRMEVPFWEDVEAYIANSPVFHVEQLNTPLLLAHGTEDGAVDFNQGVEYYNAARRAGKDFVMLVYEGENHGNSQKANQIDYHNRIVEWFGHYLKGEPAPDWVKQGVSFLDQEKAKKNRSKKAETPPSQVP
ncbi:MAG: S9 family peptidase [Gemmatimonadota bacterium]|nr:MAG: S9 family peptidase [Gemmatimonadota bacterium]